MKKIKQEKPGRKILSNFFAWAVLLLLSVPIFVFAQSITIPLPPLPPFIGGPGGGARGWSSGGTGGGWNPDTLSATGLPGSSIYGIIYNLMLWILGIFGFVGVIGFVISGIFYLTAAGNDEQIKKAKKAMMFSIIGVIVGLVGLVVIYAVNNMLTGSSTTF